jgi:hypothetical protein
MTVVERPEGSTSTASSGTQAIVAAWVVLLTVMLVLLLASTELRRHWWVLVGCLTLVGLVELFVEHRSNRAGNVLPTGAPASKMSRAIAVTPPPNVALRTMPTAPDHITGTGRLAATIAVEAWSMPKSSATAEQCEDAWAAAPERGIVAVADGASSAFMAREWAQTLTSTYVAEPPAPGLSAIRSWVDGATSDWVSKGAVPDARPEDWWSADLAGRGSFATFVGVSIHHDPQVGVPLWEAVAVGDSCVIHLRPHGAGWIRACAFPVDVPEGFRSHPDLISTRLADGQEPVPRTRSAAGELAPGDILLLATDALAQWGLAHETASPSSWATLTSCTAESLAELVRAARADGSMVDDDVTLARIALPHSPGT